MKNIVAGMLGLCVCGFGYEEVNKVVGKVIDNDEASYYRIFQDVPGFESARFFFAGESVCVEMNTEVRGVHATSFRNISPASFIALNKYITLFKQVIQNDAVRREFAATYEVGWPLVTENDIREVKNVLRKDQNCNAFYCVSNTTCAAANLGTYLGLEIDHYSEMEVSGDCGTYSVMAPVYKVNQRPYCIATSSGLLASVAYSSIFFRSSNTSINENLLKKDIVAFDNNGTPITNREVDIYLSKHPQSYLDVENIGIPLLIAAGSTITLFILNQPRDEHYLWNSGLDYISSTIPIIGLGISEAITLSLVFYNKNVKKTHKNAILNLYRRPKLKPLEEP